MSDNLRHLRALAAGWCYRSLKHVVALASLDEAR